MKRILITGGAGFIGSHVAQHLLLNSHQVIIVDNLNSCYSPELKRENLAEVSRAGAMSFHEIDICDSSALLELLDDTRPEIVVHLAARTGVRPSLQEPLVYGAVNVNGTIALLEACRATRVRKFVFASSSAVYGATNQLPFTEDDTSVLPISPYAATKIAAEKLCYTYSYLYGIQIVCLRFFTVYGPRQRPDLAICKFAELIDAGRPVPVFGDGSSARDYTHVTDIVRGVVAAADLDCAYEVVNLGSGLPVAIAAVIRTLEACLGKRADIFRFPNQPGDVPITYANISKASRLLAYRPQVTFASGIEQFVNWRRQKTGVSALQQVMQGELCVAS